MKSVENYNIDLWGHDMRKVLSKEKKKYECIIVGFPDIDEFPPSKKMTMPKYIKWVNDVLDLLFKKVKDDGYIIFMQTDRKINQSWFHKPQLIYDMANTYEFRTMWHKIMLYREPESIHLQRPTYGNMICFSKDGTPGSAFPDVIYAKTRLYKNGTPIEPLEYVCDFLKKKKIEHILDPFAGKGTIRDICNKNGISVTSVEIKSKKEMKIS